MNQMPISCCVVLKLLNLNDLLNYGDFFCFFVLFLFSLICSDREIGENISKIPELLRSLQIRRPRLETFLNQLYMHTDTKADYEPSEARQSYEEDNNSKAEETSKSDKGKTLKAAESNTGKGNRPKKGKKCKGGRKK